MTIFRRTSNPGDTTDAGMDAAAQSTMRVRDERRFREVVTTNLDFVWRAVRRFGVPDGDVEDVTQQVLLVLASKLDDVPSGKERAYLYATAARVAANARRAVRRQSAAIERLTHEPTATVPRQDQLAEQRHARELLQQLLQGLPPDLREVFWLFEVEDLSMKEVAEALGVPLGTVGSRLSRARDAFDQAVARYKAKLSFEEGVGRPGRSEPGESARDRS